MSKTTCVVRGCNEEKKTRGFCTPHYLKAWRRGELPPVQLVLGIHSLSNIDQVARIADCAVCGSGVPIKVRVRKRRPGDKNAYPAFECRIKIRAGQKPHWPATPEERRRSRLRVKYDMTPDDYERMFAEQEGRCWICRIEHPKLFVDHDHETGVVRGLLCHGCNVALGWLRDSAEAAERAALYLRTQGQLPAATWQIAAGADFLLSSLFACTSSALSWASVALSSEAGKLKYHPSPSCSSAGSMPW